MPISEMLLPEFDQEMESTRKILAVLPADDAMLSYKPHEKSMALGRLAGHIADLPNFATTILDTEKLAMKSGETKPYAPSSRQEILDHFEESAKKARAAIARTPDEEWGKVWEFTFDGKPVFSMPRIACYRTMAMSHMIHHRGQLSVYLRLCEVEIPGMYGPSADEMKFWEAKA